MKRSLIQAACGAALAACACAMPAAAQAFPERAITLVVPHSAGGTSDILARTVAAEVAKILGQSIIVDNKGGANGSIAAKMVATSAPDGYTLLLATVPNVLVVNKQVKATDVQGLIAEIKADGNGFNMASAGAGTPGHLAGEMFKQRAGLDFVHVPYKGGSPALADLIGGQVQFLFTTIPGALPHIKAGTLRALAVTSPRRSPALPDLPTMAESGLPGFQAISWHGIVAPAGTPAATVGILNQAFAKALAAPEVRQRLMEEGAEAAGIGTDEFGRFIQQEIASWAQAVKASGATAN